MPSLPRCVAWVACALAPAVCACGGDPATAGPPDASPLVPHDAAGETGAATAEGGSARSFALASGGVQLVVTGSPLGLQITPANLADDDDAIEIHQEFYGVPWDAFQAGTAPPAEWATLMNSLAASAKAAGKPVFLSVSMLNGGRDHLASKTLVQDGEVKAQDGWSTACYDFRSAPDGAALRQAYLHYVAWMIDAFSPRWLNVAVEVNLFFEKCPAAIGGVVDVANAAYDMAKAKNGGLVVFPSFQIDHLYGYSSDSCSDPSSDPTTRDACFDRAYAQIAPLERDRFAMSTYPMLAAFAGPADLPADWFTRGAKRAGERPLVAETGWNSTSMVVLPRGAACWTAFTGTPADEATYLGRVLDAAQAAGMDLVNWWSDRDLVVAPLMTDCPCTFDATWCSVLDVFRGAASDAGPDTQVQGELALKAFGTMGLRGYDGTLKAEVYSRWMAARSMTLAP
jgi:hypothetical protein